MCQQPSSSAVPPICRSSFTCSLQNTWTLISSGVPQRLRQSQKMRIYWGMMDVILMFWYLLKYLFATKGFKSSALVVGELSATLDSFSLVVQELPYQASPLCVKFPQQSAAPKACSASFDASHQGIKASWSFGIVHASKFSPCFWGTEVQLCSDDGFL